MPSCFPTAPWLSVRASSALLIPRDELAAVIACELGHFVLDHQVNNIYRAERRAKRAAFWADVFATTASAALDVAYWDDNEVLMPSVWWQISGYQQTF